MLRGILFFLLLVFVAGGIFVASLHRRDAKPTQQASKTVETPVEEKAEVKLPQFVPSPASVATQEPEAPKPEAKPEQKPAVVPAAPAQAEPPKAEIQPTILNPPPAAAPPPEAKKEEEPRNHRSQPEEEKSIFDDPPAETEDDQADDRMIERPESIFDTPPAREEEIAPEMISDRKADVRSVPSGPRVTILSREEVDAAVGYVPQSAPAQTVSYAPGPQVVPVIYRQRQVRPVPCPRKHFTVMGELERLMGRRPRNPNQRRRYPPKHHGNGIGWRVVQPAHAVRPAYPSYGPVRR